MIIPKISFKPFYENDIFLLTQWFKVPQVVEFWQESKNENEIQKKYLKKINQKGIEPYIILLKDQPIGFIQSYQLNQVGKGWWENASSGAFGIDQFIGEPNFIGKGIGTEVIIEFVKKIFLNSQATEIIADPDPLNTRAIRAYEKVGFKSFGLIATPNGKAILMKLFRTNFKQEKQFNNNRA